MVGYMPMVIGISFAQVMKRRRTRTDNKCRHTWSRGASPPQCSLPETLEWLRATGPSPSQTQRLNSAPECKGGIGDCHLAGGGGKRQAVRRREDLVGGQLPDVLRDTVLVFVVVVKERGTSQGVFGAFRKKVSLNLKRKPKLAMDA